MDNQKIKMELQTVDDVQSAVLCSHEAEEAVLAKILISPEVIVQIELHPEDFYVHKNRIIFKACIDLMQSKIQPDLITLIEVLERKKQLESIGGNAELARLMNTMIFGSDFRNHVKIIKDYSIRRRLLQVANNLASGALNLNQSVELPVEQSLEGLVGTSTSTYRSRHISQVVNEVYDDVGVRMENPGEVWGYSTGLIDIDDLLGGVQTGEVIFLAGEPGAGKSILANQIGVHISKYTGVGLFSLEMKDKRTVKRLLSAEAEVVTRDLNTGYVSDGDIAKFIHACEVVSSKNIHIWDKSGITLTQFRAECARLKKLHGVNFIILDYIYLMGGYDNFDMTPRTEALSSGVVQIAKQLDIGIVCVNSVTKEGMKGMKPSNEQLRGSGQMIHDADVVAFISDYKQDLNADQQRIELVHDARNRGLRIKKLTFTKTRDHDGLVGGDLVIGLTSGFPKFVNLQGKPEVMTEKQVDLLQGLD